MLPFIKLELKMKIISTIFCFLLLFPTVIFAHGNTLSDEYPHIGEGCSNLYYIDRDCDGYGVGTSLGTRLQMDADDMDASINSLASVEAIYGDLDGCTGTDTACATRLKTWLAARTDKAYTSKGNVYYVSTTGTTGVVNRVQSPYPSIQNALDSGAGSNDLIVIRGGTYVASGANLVYMYAARNYTAGNELVFIGMPGENPVLRGCNTGSCNNKIFNMSQASKRYLTFDSFIIDSREIETKYEGGYGFYLEGPADHIIMRNLEVTRCMEGFRYMGNVTNLLVENVVTHSGGDGMHGSYWSCGGSDPDAKAGSYTCSGIVLRNVITYQVDPFDDGPMWQFGSGDHDANMQCSGFETPYPCCTGAYTGTCTATHHWDGLLVDKCIFWGSAKAGIAFQNNHIGTTVQNSVFFNNNGWDIQWYNYGGDIFDAPKIINNSFYRGTTNNGLYRPGEPGNDPTEYSSVMLSWTWNGGSETIHNGIIRNNAWHVYDTRQIWWATQSGNIADWLIDHNVFYKEVLNGYWGATIATIDGVDKNAVQLEAYASVDANSYNPNNPNLTAVSINYYNTPWLYNLAPTVSSTNIINMGSLTLAPSTDIKGISRGAYVDIGAYEYEAGAVITATSVRTGSGTDKLNIIIWPANFTSGQQTAFETEVTANLDRLWGVSNPNGWFNTNKERFDAYKVVDSDIWGLTPSQVQAYFSSLDNGALQCTHGSSPTCKNIHVIIDNTSSGYSSTNSSYIYLNLNSGGGYYLPHEAAHVLGYGYLVDEYSGGTCNVYSDTLYNATDRNSNDKWSDLVGTDPVEGCFYCTTGLWKPTATSIMYAPATEKDFNAVGSKAMDLGLGKRSGLTEMTAPTLTGILCNSATCTGTYTSTITVSAAPTDASGIERVEFYVSATTGYPASFGIDRTSAYTATINPTSYSPGTYYLKAIAYDTNWNYTQSTPVEVTFGAGETPSIIKGQTMQGGSWK